MRSKLLKTLCCCVLMVLAALPAMAHDGYNSTPVIVGNGIGIGSAMAITICWSRTKSVLTTFLAGIFGWFYVIYYLIIRNN